HGRGVDPGTAARGPAAGIPPPIRPAAARRARHPGDLINVFRNVLSRRVCEVVRVPCFAISLMFLVARMTYSAPGPAFFSRAPINRAPANLSGRVGAFLAELSFQVFGYAAYLIPPTLVVIGWHYFWVRALKAPITKALGALLLFASIA